MNRLPGLAPAAYFTESPPFRFPALQRRRRDLDRLPGGGTKARRAVRAGRRRDHRHAGYNTPFPVRRRTIDGVERPNQPSRGNRPIPSACEPDRSSGGSMPYSLRQVLAYSLTPRPSAGRKSSSAIARRASTPRPASHRPADRRTHPPAAGRLCQIRRAARGICAERAPFPPRSGAFFIVPRTNTLAAPRRPHDSCDREKTEPTASRTRNTISRRCGRPITSASPSTTWRRSGR